MYFIFNPIDDLGDYLIIIIFFGADGSGGPSYYLLVT